MSLWYRVGEGPRQLEVFDTGAYIDSGRPQIRPDLVRIRGGDGSGRLLYRGGMHWLIAKPGSGKTWLAYEAVRQAVLDGINVLILDYEMATRAVNRLMDDLGMPRSDIEGRVIVAQLAPGAEGLADLDDLAGLFWNGQLPMLVVLDSFTALAGQLGVNPNAADEVERLVQATLEPLRHAGAAVLVIDHSTHAESRRAGGSIRKAGVADVTFVLDTQDPWQRGKENRSSLLCTKDRDGWLDQGPGGLVATVRSTPAAGGLTEVALYVPRGREAAEAIAEQTEINGAQVDALAQLTAEPQTTGAIAEALGDTSRDHRRTLAALQSLVAKRLAEVAPGTGQKDPETGRRVPYEWRLPSPESTPTGEARIRGGLGVDSSTPGPDEASGANMQVRATPSTPQSPPQGAWGGPEGGSTPGHPRGSIRTRGRGWIPTAEESAADEDRELTVEEIALALDATREGN